jgi:predicted HTH domain antitoxin
MMIPDSLLEAAHMSESELRQEIAVLLYQKERITLAQASRFAEMSRLPFQHLLASRDIPVHYGIEDFQQDLDTLRHLGRL